MIAPACGWHRVRKQPPSYAAGLAENPRLRYAGSAEFNLMAHA